VSAVSGTPDNRALVRPGDLIRIAESDYCFGNGELLMRVTVVPTLANLPGLEWVELVGVPIGHQGRESAPRAALIRVAALRRPGRLIPARPPGPRPASGEHHPP
jgi:hypothetical protein